MLTNNKPKVTATTVVKRYIPMVLPPILESLEISLKLLTPFISEAKTYGTAIIFNKFIKILPHGFIQWLVKSTQPILLANSP